MCYAFQDGEQRYITPLEIQGPSTLHNLLSSPALTPEQRQEREARFGRNAVIVDTLNSVALLATEILTPFHIFQVLALVFLSYEGYYYYAICILAISVLSAMLALNEARRSRLEIAHVTASSDCSVSLVLAPFVPSTSDESQPSSSSLMQENQPTTMRVDPETLVPGDIIVIEAGVGKMPCDAVLIQGSCLVNESALTGL